MKAQFFIISSVIIIYIITLSFQYLTGFSDIKISGVEEQQDFSYIEKIKNSFFQAFNISNYTNNGDLSMIVEDMNFNKNFSNQELLKRGISFDSKFIFFSNGFETGDMSEWTSFFGTPSIDSGTKYDGNYSLYSYGLEGVSKKLDGVGEVYARVYVNFSTLPLNPYIHYFIGFYDHGNQILGLGVWNDGGTYKLRAYSLIGAGSNWVSPIYISQDDWHYFELYWYENGTNSRVKGWYDGNLKIDQITDSQGKGKAVDEYKFGGVDIGGGSTDPDLFIDCAAIGADYIGGDCYPDVELYFVFSLKTKEMYTKTGFPYYSILGPDTTSPTYSNPQTSTTIAGQPSDFTLDWSDNVGLSGYIFSTNNSGTWQNSSWISFGGLGSMTAWNVTTLNSTVGTVVGWKYYANDTSNNLATSSTYTLTTTSVGDSTPPTYSNNVTNDTVAGKPVQFSLTMTDNIALQTNGQYIFGLDNCTGSFVNDSAVNFISTPQTISVVKKINSTIGCKIRWYFNFSDNSSNWNSTIVSNTFNFTTKSYYPQYSFNSTNDTKAGKPISHNLYWTDDSGLSGYIFSTNNTGAWYNTSFTSMTGIGNWSNVTIPYLFPADFSSVGIWHLDEGSGTTTSDSSGNGNTGKLYSPKWVNGKLGNALQFNGSGDYVDVGNNSALNFKTNDFTISAWFKTNGTVNSWSPADWQHVIYYKNKNNTNNVQGLFFGIGGALQWPGQAVCFINGEATYLNSPARYDDSNWHFLTCSVNRSGNAFLYVDGKQVATVSTSGWGNYNSIYNASIGYAKTLKDAGFTTGFGFNGTIDEVRVYNRSLTANEIMAQYAYSFPANSTVGKNVQWCVYANDTSNNWNSTSCVNPFSFITT
jgi:hypothetical protein